MFRKVSAFVAIIALASCATMSKMPGMSRFAKDTTEEFSVPLPENTSDEIREQDLHTRIKILASDTFEGRDPGTPRGEAAAYWIADELRRVGVSPAGESSAGELGKWFQNVKMISQTLNEEKSYLTVKNGDEVHEMELGKDAVIWTKHQHGNKFSFEDSQMVFVGYGVVAPEYGWNDYEGIDATGKTVVMLVNDPGYANPQGDLFKGKAMTYYGRWTYKFEEAARQGATAAIVIHETAPASYGWDVVSNSWSGAQADLVRKNRGRDRAILEGWFSFETAKKVFATVNLDFEMLKNKAKSKDFRPVDLGNLKADGMIVQKREFKSSRNVVGVVKGKTSPDEYVLYMAHWDHLGKKSGKKTGARTEDFYKDEIFNGAVDNASGTAALIEIAETIAAQGADRSVMFVAVTLEESGLLGSAYYAENPTVPLNTIVSGINMDALLPLGRTKDVIVVGHGASELEDRLKMILEKQGRYIVPDTKPEAGYFYRSDHISLAKKGVPMIYADGGINLRKGGMAAGLAASEAFTAQRYHKPMDEYSSDWDLSGTTEDIQALFELGYGIANSIDWPQWYEGNEFKAIRDESMKMDQ